MRRLAHGFSDTDGVGAAVGTTSGLEGLPANADSISMRFDYRFDVTKDPLGLLPESPATLEFLSKLGASMRNSNPTNFSSDIPSGYTYLGQFIDHDITFTDVKKPANESHSTILGRPGLTPWSREEVLEKVTNKRNSILQLDSVYGTDFEGNYTPTSGPFFEVGKVSRDPYFPIIVGKDQDNDLPRHPMSKEPSDRVAKIGDRRNDQNLVISQLHVAFLRAHNATVRYLRDNKPVAPELEFGEAQKQLRQHYHWLVIHDFLEKRVGHPGMVEEIVEASINSEPKGEFFLPLEFTIAAFRFGHSMVRHSYYLNNTYRERFLMRMFTLTALSGPFGPTPGRGFETLPWSKIIQWRKFLDGLENVNRAQPINTRMVEPLFNLLDEKELPVPGERSLAVQDLKRGYMMRMPTGQAVARQLRLPELTEAELASVALTNNQADLLSGTAFARQTPLWFYLLAEANHYSRKVNRGSRLGPVGTRLVADVIVDLVRRSSDSILDPSRPQPWTPYLGSTPGKFDLQDLLEFAGVLEP